MRKILVCLMAGTLAFAAGACGNSSDTDQGAAETEETVVSAETEVPEEDEAAADEQEAAGPEAAEEETQDAEEDAEEEIVQAPDVSGAVDGQTTSDTDPVPLGTWAETALYATQDSTYHTVYVRVTDVTTQSEDSAYVDAAIETSNRYGEEDESFDPSELDVPEDGELVVLDYEVYVPEDFPAPNYGMTEPRIYFSIKNIGGGGFPSADGSDVYVGMGSTKDLIVREAGETYEPGNTYAEKCIYAMVDGYTDYVAAYSSYPDGTDSDETSEDNMYTVYHSVN